MKCSEVGNTIHATGYIWAFVEQLYLSPAVLSDFTSQIGSSATRWGHSKPPMDEPLGNHNTHKKSSQ